MEVDKGRYALDPVEVFVERDVRVIFPCLFPSSLPLISNLLRVARVSQAKHATGWEGSTIRGIWVKTAFFVYWCKS